MYFVSKQDIIIVYIFYLGGIEMNVVEKIEKYSKDVFLKKTVEILEKNPEKNVDKIFELIKYTISNPYEIKQIDVVYDLYKNNEAIHNLIQNILTTTNKNCLDKFFINFFANAVWFGGKKRDTYLKNDDTMIPFTILISPSMRCTLKCSGCYAARYSKKDDIPFEELDRIIGEARDLGVYYIIILGGEPFINDYMLDIYEKYPDVMFSPFTNGQLITTEIVDRLQKAGNVIPMFSLEGFEKETDARRGKGVFQGVMKSMDLFKERGMLFGVSSATSRANIDTVTSDEFIDMLIEKGAKIGWYFIYMPVGESPNVDLMLTPKQRIELGEKVRNIRTNKPYFAVDFFNDAPYVGGCIAGRSYCHINSKEEIEPCIFAHFSTYNVKNKPLVDAFKTEFFKTLRKSQPYNKNMLMPCMMIDNPKVVRNFVKKVGAHVTDPSAEKMLSDTEFMSKLDKLASDFKVEAEKEWKKVFSEKNN